MTKTVAPAARNVPLLLWDTGALGISAGSCVIAVATNEACASTSSDKGAGGAAAVTSCVACPALEAAETIAALSAFPFAAALPSLVGSSIRVSA